MALGWETTLESAGTIVIVVTALSSELIIIPSMGWFSYYGSLSDKFTHAWFYAFVVLNYSCYGVIGLN